MIFLFFVKSLKFVSIPSPIAPGSGQNPDRPLPAGSDVYRQQ
jgi:hypothetical protein